MKNKLMVDCETLDIGERPVLLSIGAVVFNDQQILHYFDAGISTESTTDFDVSQDTLDWWSEQSLAAREQAFSGTENIKDALIRLVNFYTQHECTEIWSKGALADIRWINNALSHFDIDRPWKFYKEFCFRTLLKSVPQFEIPFTGTPHSALDDAIHQAKQFIHIKHIQREQAHILIERGQRFNEMAQKVADLEFKILQMEESA